MKDRLIRGFIAGAIAGLLMSILNILSFTLGFADTRYVDFAGEFVLGKVPVTLWEDSISFISHIIFTGFLGVVFAYLIPLINSSYYLFKGWLYGITVWFIIYAIGIMFDVPLLDTTSVSTATSNFITTSIYGLFMAEILRRLDEQIKT